MKLRNIKPNLHALEVGKLTIWFSYAEPIAFHISGHSLQLSDKRWSNATSRHREFVREGFAKGELYEHTEWTQEDFEADLEEALYLISKEQMLT